MSPKTDRFLLSLSIEVSATNEALAVVDAFQRFLENRYPGAKISHKEIETKEVGEINEVRFQKTKSGGNFIIHLQVPVIFSVESPEALPLDHELDAIHEIMKCYCSKVQLIADLRGLSYTDDVTGLYNQRYLELILERELSLSRRNETQFSVLFLDLDYFKNINDSHGHMVGTRLLYDVGQEIKRTLRESDITFRYGGDEFVVILSQTGLEDAMMVSERIRQQVEKKRFLAKDGHEIRITTSIGVATVPTHALTKQQILKAADEALYGIKKTNRNQVIASSAKPED